MRRFLKLGLTLLVLTLARPLAAQDLIFNTEEYPPFNYTGDNGEIAGVATEVVRELLARTGVRATIRLLPWTRAYTEALNLPHVCVFSTSRTEERETLFRWVGPLVRNDWVVYALEDSPVRVESLDDLRTLRVGGYRDDATSVYLQSQGITVSEAPNDRLNARKLAAGRIDVWASGRFLAPYYARVEDIGPLRPLLSLREVDMALACNPAVPDTVIGPLQEALVDMHEDGSYERIMSGLP